MPDAAPSAPSAPVEIAAPVVGTAGGSARREFERRAQRRDQRIRTQHPRLGGLILALTDDPQSTTAWATGAHGEEQLARRLDAAASPQLRLLHDRRIPRTTANIDHIAVTPTGVYVIDAKRYRGRPHLLIDGGLIRPRTEKLVVGRRDCTKLVDGIRRQVDVVHAGLQATHPNVPVVGVLCFIEADWPLIGKPFSIGGIDVMWPKKLEQRLRRPGDHPRGTIAEIHAGLASLFSPA
jgi:hypothetical protein